MNLADRLSQNHLDNLFQIYLETTGSTTPARPVLEEVRRRVHGIGHYELHAGSRWCPGSKFLITERGVYFHPECFPETPEDGKEIREAETTFNMKINDYLHRVLRFL